MKYERNFISAYVGEGWKRTGDYYSLHVRVGLMLQYCVYTHVYIRQPDFKWQGVSLLSCHRMGNKLNYKSIPENLKDLEVLFLTAGNNSYTLIHNAI
ncbi:hypothetical protein M8C21_020949, partial [Ambrosia artemisiifolia]